VTDPIRPCARSCVRAGTEDTPEYLPATHGAYCARCWGRLEQALIQAPELAAHILGNITNTGGASDDRVDSSRDAPLPFNQAAFDDVSELYALLVYWTGIWAEYLEQRTPAPTARVWRRDSGTVVGLPAGSTPEKGSAEVARMSRWLRDRLDTILTLAPEDIDEFTEGLDDVWRMAARWPLIEKPRYSKMPCPELGCEARIAVFPPRGPGGVKSVSCDSGHYFPEEEYDELTLRLTVQRIEQARQARAEGRRRQAGEKTEEQKAADVRAHLWRKYGGEHRIESA
jgi:hypothetical protein